MSSKHVAIKGTNNVLCIVITLIPAQAMHVLVLVNELILTILMLILLVCLFKGL